MSSLGSSLGGVFSSISIGFAFGVVFLGGAIVFSSISVDSSDSSDSTSSGKEKANDYKDIKTYKPSGSLIYSNNLLKKLDINDL